MMNMDVTQHVIDFLLAAFPTVQLAGLGGTGQRVVVSADVDKRMFNAAVANAFTFWKEYFWEAPTLAMFEEVMMKVTPPDSVAEAIDPNALEQLKREFTRPYMDNLAPAQFEAFIGRCWREYCEEGGIRPFPYTTIVQSSGFGKSRLLLELATRTKAKQGADAHMCVMYTCVRDVVRSTGYPTVTPTLGAYFFSDEATKDDTLVDRLCRLYDCAMDRRDTVGENWIGLFTDSSSDATVYNAISGFTCSIPPAIKPCESFADRRIVVFAIDEARALLKTIGTDRVNRVRRVRWALRAAYKLIRAKFGRYAGIFAVLVDTNSKISDIMPPAAHDSSSRGLDGQSVLFPPFVLTHTIAYDALLEEAQATSVSSINSKCCM